jgi:hypothetical protein
MVVAPPLSMLLQPLPRAPGKGPQWVMLHRREEPQVAMGTLKSMPPAVTVALVPLGTKSGAADLGPAVGVLLP